MSRLPASLRTARHAGYQAFLRGFAALPNPVRRQLVHAGTPNFTVGAVVAIEHDGRVLFLRQAHREGWSLPGGLLDRGETAAQAVVREAREETGLRIAVGHPLCCQVNPRVRRVDVIFHVRADQLPAVRPASEASGHDWLPLDAVNHADGPTREIIAVLRAALSGQGFQGRVL